MKSGEKTIAHCQTLIRGRLCWQGEKINNAFRRYVLRIVTGSENNVQNIEIEVRKSDEIKCYNIKDDSIIECLCWVNGKAWQDRVFITLSLIQIDVIEDKTEEPQEVEEYDDLSWIDEGLDF